MIKSIFALAAAVLLTTAPAHAANAPKPDGYPAKPVEMIVSFAAGGGLDTTIRVIAKHAEKILGQRIVVSNKTGGGNIQGNVEAMKAKPDGQVIGTWGNGLVTDQLLLKGIPYTYKDVQPLCMVGNDPNVIAVGKKWAEEHNIKTLADLLKYCKANDGKVTFGAGGNWTPHDFLRIKLEEAGGFKFNRMPFAGGAPAMQAVAGGSCDVASPFLPEIISMLDSGTLLPLAVAFTSRVAQLPDVPSTAEAGYPDIVQGIWRVLSVPKNTPKPLVNYLASVFEQTLNNAEFKVDAKKLGINPVYMGPEELTVFLDKEFKFYETKTEEWGIRVK